MMMKCKKRRPKVGKMNIGLQKENIK